MRGSDTCELLFEGCRVPAENVLGEEVRGAGRGALCSHSVQSRHGALAGCAPARLDAALSLGGPAQHSRPCAPPSEALVCACSLTGECTAAPYRRTAGQGRLRAHVWAGSGAAGPLRGAAGPDGGVHGRGAAVRPRAAAVWAEDRGVPGGAGGREGGRGVERGKEGERGMCVVGVAVTRGARVRLSFPRGGAASLPLAVNPPRPTPRARMNLCS